MAFGRGTFGTGGGGIDRKAGATWGKNGEEEKRTAEQVAELREARLQELSSVDRAEVEKDTIKQERRIAASRKVAEGAAAELKKEILGGDGSFENVSDEGFEKAMEKALSSVSKELISELQLKPDQASYEKVVEKMELEKRDLASQLNDLHDLKGLLEVNSGFFGYFKRRGIKQRITEAENLLEMKKSRIGELAGLKNGVMEALKEEAAAEAPTVLETAPTLVPSEVTDQETPTKVANAEGGLLSDEVKEQSVQEVAEKKMGLADEIENIPSKMNNGEPNFQGMIDLMSQNEGLLNAEANIPKLKALQEKISDEKPSFMMMKDIKFGNQFGLKNKVKQMLLDSGIDLLTVAEYKTRKREEDGDDGGQRMAA